MRNNSTPRPATWHELSREADAVLTFIDRPAAGASANHRLTSLSCSFDTTSSAELNIAGLTSVGGNANDGVYGLDGTDVAVVVLASDKFTVASHGFTNGDHVMLNLNGGTTVTGILGYTAYWIVGVSGSDFQLAATKGGSAIALSGTPASFSDNIDVMRISHSYMVYDHLELDFSSPLEGAENRDLIISIKPTTGIQALLSASGYN